MGEPILRLSDISLSFKGIKALSNLSFDVKAGEICALIGPNGAGKSSLLNVICGVYRADDGEISFAGQTLSVRQALDSRSARHFAHLPT
jgi:branched-chain amino acid transport system ATP-binding protein